MNKRKILLIDYDPASIQRTSTPLLRAGYEVEVAKDGLAGLAAFERSQPALVLVEAMLPRKHGFEVCKEIKAKPHGDSTPVLITTAVCRGRKYRMDALQIYGCDEYVEKPISDEDLIALIARFVAQAESAREEVTQELSAAIDALAPPTARGGPQAIESMTDDEIEAKIDALLMADETPTEGTEPIIAPVLLGPAPADESVQVVEEDVDDVLLQPEGERERRLEAMIHSEPRAPAVIQEDPEAEPIDDVVAEVPVVDSSTDLATETPVCEWTETRTESKSRSKMLVAAAVVLLVLGAGGFLAFQQGWLGGTQKSPIAENPTPVEHAADFAPPVQLGTVALPLPAETAAADPNQLIAERSVVGEPPVEVEAAKPMPIVPPKPTYQPPSKAERDAAAKKMRNANAALSLAAGALQTELLDEPIQDEPIPTDVPQAESVADASVTSLIGTPVRPPTRRGELIALQDVDQGPTRVQFKQPVYDEMARRQGQQGVVVVEVLIDESGNVVDARVTQEIPRSRLNAATLRAARAWVFKPAMKDGVPVKVWKSERIEFRL